MANASNSTVSICGIDVGTENCYVAVARQGGIEILLNEYSQRSTPAYIAFGGNQRELGVSAKQKQMMNLKNTCFAPSLIIGKRYKDLNIKEIPYNIVEDQDGLPVVVVNHNNEENRLSPTQVLAMLFTKLRQIAGGVIDCVINCPNYFTDSQKRSLIDAAQIAGLNPLKIVPDMTAIALYYGFYRSSSGQENSIVGFVDCGQTSIQASIVLFNHKENSMRVLDAGYETNVGGKYFDEILADHFIHQKNLKLNDRARYRLIAECEKVKKQMSANSNELPINIECLYEDRDFSARVDRATFEQLSENLLLKIKGMLQSTYDRALEKYNKDFADKLGEFKVDSVEIVGGTSRIPAIKHLIKQIFGVESSTTLNADEAVARGCALQCAILSPTFKVAKELQIIDSLAYQVNFRYSVSNGEFKNVASLYPRGHQFPFTKQISLSIQTLPVTAAFDYVDNSGAIVPFAQFLISQPENNNVLDILQKSPIKLRVRIDHNGLISIVSASVSYEKSEMSNNEMETNENDSKMDTSDSTSEQTGEQQDAQSPNVDAKRKSKPKTVTIELQVQQQLIAGKLPKEFVQKYLEFESNLILADKNWKEKTDAKNALEEFIYEWRDRLESGSYDAFINGTDKKQFQAQLEDNETWLYKQDEEELMHSKSVYDEKTQAMANAYANKVIFRKREFENRPRVLEQVGYKLQQARKLFENVESEEQEELTKFQKEIDEKQLWFDDVQGRMLSAPTFDDPQVKCEEISQQASQIEVSINRIQNSRLRRAEQKRKAAADAAAAAEAAKKAEQQKQEAGDDNATNDKMEVDPEQPTA